MYSKMHNPLKWKPNRTPRNSRVNGSSNQMLLTQNHDQEVVVDTLFDGSFVQQLRWALIQDISSGIISAESLSKCALAKVAFKQTGAPVPVCFD